MKIDFLDRATVESYFTKVVQRAEDLSPAVREGRDPCDASLASYDFSSLLEGGLDGLLAPLAIDQPETFAIVSSMSPRICVGEHFYFDPVHEATRWRGYAFLELEGRMIWIKPYLKGGSASTRRLRSIPEPIARAYYARMAGLDVIPGLGANAMRNHVLPADINIWPEVEGVWRIAGKKRAALKSALANLASGEELQPNAKSGTFRCFVDTRQQGDTSNVGWILFVFDGGISQRVYAMSDADPASVRAVGDPRSLLDAYVAHVLGRGDTDFPFADYLG
jgi:hypothetical protein